MSEPSSDPSSDLSHAVSSLPGIHPGASGPLLAIVEELRAATSVTSAARAAANCVFNMVPRAVIVRILVVEDGRLREIAAAGDRRVASDRRAPRVRALESRRAVETQLVRPAGYRLVDVPLCDGKDAVGVLEVAAPVEVLPEVSPSLAWFGWHAAMAMQRLAREADIRGAGEREAARSFSLGLKVATAVGRAGERRKAYREVVRILGNEMKSPAIAWRVHPSAGRLEVLETAGVAWRPKEDLTLRCAVISEASRAHLLYEVCECARFALRLAKVTLIDAGDVVITLGGDHKVLEGSGRWLREILATVPDLSATVRLASEPTMSERALLEGLTDRERDVLVLLTTGLSTDAIATTLVISPKTVKTHVQNILGKLGVRSRLEAAAMASRSGLVAEVAS